MKNNTTNEMIKMMRYFHKQAMMKQNIHEHILAIKCGMYYSTNILFKRPL